MHSPEDKNELIQRLDKAREGWIARYTACPRLRRTLSRRKPGGLQTSSNILRPSRISRSSHGSPWQKSDLQLSIVIEEQPLDHRNR